jgi:hypothetical protein
MSPGVGPQNAARPLFAWAHGDIAGAGSLPEPWIRFCVSRSETACAGHETVLDVHIVLGIVDDRRRAKCERLWRALGTGGRRGFRHRPLASYSRLKIAGPPKGSDLKSARPVRQRLPPALQAEAHKIHSTRLRGPAAALHLWCGSLGLIIVPRDDQCPISAAGRRIFCARYTNPRRALHQKIFSMPTRIDPLIEGFGEAVVPISDIFGSASGT